MYATLSFYLSYYLIWVCCIELSDNDDEKEAGDEQVQQRGTSYMSGEKVCNLDVYFRHKIDLFNFCGTVLVRAEFGACYNFNPQAFSVQNRTIEV